MWFQLFRNRGRRIAMVLLVPVLASGACTSGDRSRPDAATTTDAMVPRITPGGELVLGLEAEVRTLAPGEAARPSEVTIALGIYDPLMTYVDGKVEPHLAQKVESSDDLTEHVITLRDDVTFHDGTPLDASAVVRHFERLKDPATRCPCFAEIAQISSMATPDGPDGLTVVFNLATPNVAFPDLLAGPSGYIESPAATTAGIDLAVDGVGTGPFELESHEVGVRTVLVANPDYWDTDAEGTRLPYLDKLTLVPMRAGEDGLKALTTGAIDILQTIDLKTVRQAEAAPVGVQKITSSASPILLFNNAAPPFHDERARRAVAYAVDKSVINERVYEGVSLPSYSLFDHRSGYFNSSANAPSYDPERAAQLVDELEGLRFTITCPDSREADVVMPIIEELGEAAGMDISVEIVDGAAFDDRVRGLTGRYEAACYRSPDFVDPDALRPALTTDDFGNLAFFSNDEVDELFDLASRTTDFHARREHYFRVQEILAEEMPLLTTVYDLQANIYDDARVGRPPDAEPGTQGAIKPGLLYALGG